MSTPSYPQINLLWRPFLKRRLCLPTRAGSKVRMEAVMKPAVCLKCGCTDIRRSKRHGPLEWVLKRFFIVPWRCMSCDDRFFRSSFRRISFTRREIPKLWRMWVTFRTVLRSFSLFMILCFATAHSSPVHNALIVPKPCIALYRFLTSFDVFLGTDPSLNVRSLTN